jgi:plastocyanin
MRPLVVSVLILLAGCAPARPATHPRLVEVHLTCTTDSADTPCAFRPAEVSIASGDTVRWVNDDATYHTVTSTDSLDRRVPNGRFAAVLDTAGATFTHTFTQPGSYPYYCQPHAEFMTGTVRVVAPR